MYWATSILACVLAGAAGWAAGSRTTRRCTCRLRRRGARARESPGIDWGHARATVAVLKASIDYVEMRLRRHPCGIAKEECRALAWLLSSLSGLWRAADGTCHVDRSCVRSELAALDRAVGPKSLWRVTQGLEGQRPQLPELTRVYSDALAELTLMHFGPEQDETSHRGNCVSDERL